MASSCILCAKELTPDKTRCFKRQAIEKLIGISLQLGDGKHNALQNLQSVNIHNSCYATYTRPRSIESATKKMSKGTTQVCTNEQAPLDTESFDFKNFCFLCGDDASDEYIVKSKKCPKKYVLVHVVENNDTVYKIINSLETRENGQYDLLRSRLSKSINYVHQRARYHKPCYTSFAMNRMHREGRPYDQNILQTVNFVINFLTEHREECQFSLKDILLKYKGSENVSVRYIKDKLIECFGNDLVVCPTQNDYIVCFVDVRNKIICNDWYKKRKDNEEDERRRMVDAAAKIILEDIRKVVYKLDEYPAPNSFLNDVSSMIPSNLKHFLDILIKTNKKDGAADKWERTTQTFSHAIISAVRPRSFVSPILLGLSSLIHKKYAAKNLIHSLSHLGLCSSYSETLKFEASVVVDPQKYDLNAAYLQFVFDNADFNACTLDGRNSFHAMGGIMCVTPSTAIKSESTIVRLKKIPTASSIGTFGDIPLKYFTRSKTSTLADISVKDLRLETDKIVLKPVDFLWFFGKSDSSEIIPGWNGFSEMCVDLGDCIRTKIVPLPFVNNPPTNYNTIMTVLIEAGRRCIANGQRHTFVTFDQPLYQKAREILACSAGTTYEQDLSHVVVRLGGFHSLMSFLGAIGFVMEGSGLFDIFSLLFAPNSAVKALSGHAFSRAVRGHTLVQCALAIYLLSIVDMNENEKDVLKSTLTGVQTGSLNYSSDFMNVQTKFENFLETQKNNGPTSALWVQYFAMVQIFKDFIEAEKNGDWQSHLLSLQRMLPYYHASGHTLYAKSVQLYLQDMYSLQDFMDPFEYEAFTDRSYFTIKRKMKRRAGNFTDQVIEQSLMRSMKTSGGLTRGRGISDSVVAKWILSTVVLLDVSDSIEDFCGSNYSTSEQHVDQSEGRISRDTVDLKKLLSFFKMHNPFPITEKIINISTGIVGSDEINCHQAFTVGNKIMNGIIGKNFSNVKFERKKKVLSLKTVSSSVTINNEVIAVDPTTIFTRACLLMKTKEDLKYFFSFELSPYPRSLFCDMGMRKTNKSSFYSNFDCFTGHIPHLDTTYVVDGGFLLHKVVWQANENIDRILALYTSYVCNHFTPNSVVIFDGYTDVTNVNCVKIAERQRRKNRIVNQEIDLTTTSIISLNQESFLSNDKNKQQLIKLLCRTLGNYGFRTNVAEDDADHLIINTAIDIRQESQTIAVVGEDIDLLVLLCQLVPEDVSNIYFIKPGKGRTPESAYDSKSFKYSSLRHLVAFIHVFCGCDSTSSFYNIGKNKLITILDANNELQSLAQMFYDESVDREQLAVAGKTLIGKLYAGKVEFRSLNELRYTLFEKCTNKAKFKLEVLPPTEDAAEQHCYRAYVQLQKWHGNKLDATEWGWAKTDEGIKPITTVGPVIPEQLLQKFACGCQAGCKSKSCTCRKNGVRCSYLCSGCQGQSCSNAEKVQISVESNTMESLDIDEASNDCLLQYIEEDTNSEADANHTLNYFNEYEGEVFCDDDDDDDDILDNDDDNGDGNKDDDVCNSIDYDYSCVSVFSDEPPTKKIKLV